MCYAKAKPVETELDLDTKSGRLFGTLTIPASKNADWVVLIVSGSGPTDRNGNNTQAINNSLKLLAEGLADAGIASVRYDKRGVAESAAALKDERTLRFETYVDDASAWVKSIKSTHRFANVAILGHSEGALTALLTVNSETPQAYISIAGVGRKASDLLRTQMTGKLPEDLAIENERILSSLERNEEVANVPTALLAYYKPSVQPYLISWFKHDPAKILQKISLPTLIIQGSTDIQVGIQDYDLLCQAAPTAICRIIPNMNHILKVVDSDLPTQIASYRNPTLSISPIIIATIKQFLETVPLKISK